MGKTDEDLIEMIDKVSKADLTSRKGRPLSASVELLKSKVEETTELLHTLPERDRWLMVEQRAKLYHVMKEYLAHGQRERTIEEWTQKEDFFQNKYKTVRAIEAKQKADALHPTAGDIYEVDDGAVKNRVTKGVNQAKLLMQIRDIEKIAAEASVLVRRVLV
jgi:hypothetical protein